jgi:hypothetical protein
MDSISSLVSGLDLSSLAATSMHLERNRSRSDLLGGTSFNGGLLRPRLERFVLGADAAIVLEKG